MNRVTLTTHGITQGRAGRVSDIDLANDIVGLAKRGYICVVRSEPSTPYSLSLYLAHDIWVMNAYWFADKVLGLDPHEYDEPEWSPELRAYLKALIPELQASESDPTETST